MVSGRSTSHSLASELVKSNDGHEEIIKVNFAHLHSSSLPSFSLQACDRRQLTLPQGHCGLTWKNQTCNASSWSFPGKILINTRRPQSVCSDFGAVQTRA